MNRFQFFPNDWLAGTADLTAEETGCFISIVAMYMGKDGALQDDDVKLARICKVSLRRWRAHIKPRLIDGGFIEVREGFIWQAKCEERLEKDGFFSRSQKDKAKKRWGKSSLLKTANHLNAQETAEAPAAAPAPAPADAIPTPSLTNVRGPAAQKPPGRNGKDETPLTSAQLVFGECREFLTKNGETYKHAGSLLGKWRQKYSDEAVIEVVRAAERQAISDPVPWIIKTLEYRQRGRARGQEGLRPSRPRVAEIV